MDGISAFRFSQEVGVTLWQKMFQSQLLALDVSWWEVAAEMLW